MIGFIADGFSLLFLAQDESAPLGRPSTGSVAMSATLAAGAVFAGVLLVGYWYQRRIRSRTPGLARDEGRALAADLTELTDRLAQEMDAKSARLEALIAAADERIRHLERMDLGVPRTSTGVDPRLIEPRTPAHRVRHENSGVQESHREVYELADAGLSPVDIARQLDRPTGQVELILNLRRGSVAL
jgi:hypothetical protein